MNGIAGEPPPGRYAVQLAAVWLLGSTTLGTLALALLSRRDGYPQPLMHLPPGESAFVYLLLLALAAGLLLVGWRTADATWLRGGPRAVLLWTAVVGGAGFAGWLFAAVAALVAEFPYGIQIALVYIGGGLPFALVAGLLQRPVRVNVVAAALVVVALVAGFLIAGIGVFGLLGQVFMLMTTMLLPFGMA